MSIFSTSSRSPLAVCADLARALVQTERLDQLYEAGLDALEQGLNVQRGAILLFDADGTMRFKAWRGISGTYRKAVEGHTPWSRQTRRATPVVVVDVSLDPALAPYLETIRNERIAAMTFVPLEGADGVIGKFMLYYAEPHDPSSEELQLAGLIAAQVAFAVQRTKAHLLATESEARLRFALSAANMGTWDWDLDTGIVIWSDNMEQIHGLPEGSFEHTFESYEREIHEEDRGRVRASIERALADNVPHDVEYRIVDRDGTIRWVAGKGRLEHGPDGQRRRMTGVCMNITPRKQVEQARLDALDQSNRTSQRLAAIVESSDDAIVSKDLRGVIRSWNRGAERMFGYSEPEVIGKPITIIVPAERLDEEEMVLSRIRTGNAVEMETVRRHKDGSTVEISLKVSPVRDSTGRIVGASKIARDIGARKRAEAERAELHRRLAMLVAASATLLESPEAEPVRAATVSLARELLDADGCAVWTTPPGQVAWRAVKSEGISARFASRVIAASEAAATVGRLVDPLPVSDVETHPLLEPQLAACREEGIQSLLICPMHLETRRSGTLVFYYRTRRVFKDMDIETGQALANLAAAALTTAGLYDEQRIERAAAEGARRQATFLADAAAILSQSLDYEDTLARVAQLAVPEIADWCAVDVLDRDGELHRLAVAHVDPAKIDRARLLQQRYPADPNSPNGVHHVIRTGKPVIVGTIPPELVAGNARDEQHRRGLEELALASYMCVPLVSTSGTIGAITFGFAESGRHYTDHDLAFARDLAARAALAVDNAFAYRREHEANRLKDEFLATLSHELRTPLNAVLGYAQMLNMGILKGERYSKAITVLTRNAEALRQMIDDVLDVSRITSGKLRLNMRPLKLEDILKDAIATVQPTADAKGVSLQLEIDPAAPSISGDPDRLQQVVWNVLSNAVKFTPPGGHVQLCLSKAGSGVEIEVSDDGQGIDPAFISHIFERFRQADSRFSREHGGLGLGLAIVRDLVELHGGTISAFSRGLGTGAMFRISLPAIATSAREAIAARQVHPHREPVSDELSERLTGIRVLAIDDEEDALELLRVVLESAGANVTTAGSGADALEQLRHTSFDAVIADIGMPRMDGLEFVRRLRQTLPPPANRVPAAALTAYARSEDRGAVLAGGFQLHLAKPLNPTELVNAVVTLLSGDRPS